MKITNEDKEASSSTDIKDRLTLSSNLSSLESSLDEHSRNISFRFIVSNNDDVLLSSHFDSRPHASEKEETVDTFLLLCTTERLSVCSSFSSC